MQILSVVGARLDFLRLAPIERELVRRSDVRHIVIHTGRPFDPGMSEAFFQDHGIAPPHQNLGVEAGAQTWQTAEIMVRLEPVLQLARPDVVLLYGDANSTVAAALVAAKLGRRIGHVEAGLRSGDRSMPQEINRVVTDRLSDLLFAPSPDAVDRLEDEGIPPERIHFVGNVVIDSLCWALAQARKLDPVARQELGGIPFVVATLHRPSTVDDPATLRELLETLALLSGQQPVLVSVHPRTRDCIRALGFPGEGHANLRLLEPMGYLERLGLVAAARLVITDSGGVEETATYLGIPCFTMWPNTERPIICRPGAGRLVPPRRDAILAAVRHTLQQPPPARPVIERWDGRTAERVVAVLCDGAAFTEEEGEPPASATTAGAVTFAELYA